MSHGLDTTGYPEFGTESPTFGSWKYQTIRVVDPMEEKRRQAREIARRMRENDTSSQQWKTGQGQ